MACTLVKAPDTEYLKSRYVDLNHNIEVGIYPVLFGWRVHAGRIGSGCYELDYCCGNTQQYVNLILSLVMSILQKNDANFRIFPFQEQKPVFNDQKCFARLIELAGDFDIVIADDIHALRPLIMKDLNLNFL